MTATISPAASREFWTKGILSSTTNYATPPFWDAVEGGVLQVGAIEPAFVGNALGLIVGLGAYAASLSVAHGSAGFAEGASTLHFGIAIRDFDILVDERLPRMPRGTMSMAVKFELGAAQESRLLGGSEVLEE